MGLDDITKRKKAILGFLYANSMEPVDKIHLMKEVFWLSGNTNDYKELIENYGAYDYGPDDQELEADVDELIAFGYAEQISDKEKKYKLTNDGKNIIPKLLSDDELIVYETIKQTMNKLNFEELLYLVYKRFPEFAVNSVAKNVLRKEKEMIPKLIAKGAISQAYAAKLLKLSIQDVQRLYSRC
ncbi:hypothetical protein COV61_02720 [Candidatus Micrarchaeota archaeon CG11_big_fil_rev_8_21_14_0_20_47_5]|nr:MAG: hypothetical protein AUJ17_01435 [Candidatus Micrarchaeota archaeon CG1_02_47_40]PIN83577.1 MAG: hypothetical protein COV61_02720 [Candidatus Micrarchaeota archaeon CG11_big_fil_rev_8_21_14_0_20_47_5]